MVVHHADGQEDDTLRNLDAAQSNLDVIKKLVPEFSIDYGSKIEQIKAAWHAALSQPPPLHGLRTVADLIESLHGDITALLPHP
jgi:hypothetical protein